jgi:hypothetical protein
MSECNADPFEVRPDRSGTVQSLVKSLLLAAIPLACLFLFRDEIEKLKLASTRAYAAIWVLSVVLSLTGIVASIAMTWRLMASPILLRISSEGIQFISFDFIAWNEVDHMSKGKIGNDQVLMIHLKDVEGTLNNQGWLKRMMLRLAMRFGGATPFVVSDGPLPIFLKQVIREIRRCTAIPIVDS